jgi:ribosomal protein L3 glutamine methyltransferase
MPQLSSIRDLLRFAVSEFRRNKLVHGHGTASPIDEAAFLILETLHLPVEDINPWLDAVVTDAELQRVLKNIETRVTSRKPAAYVVHKTYLQGVPFFVDERVIVPRSYIAELFAKGLLGADGEPLLLPYEEIKSVLDLCTGSGCLAVLASHYFPQATIEATDISQDALDVATINLAEHGLSSKITLHKGDLFAPVQNKTYDLIVANPPYVAQAEVDAFPAEYKCEPALAHLGGADGFDLVRKILRSFFKHLQPGGSLLCEIGLGRELLEEEFPDLPFIWLDTDESEGEVFLLTL